MGGLDGYFTVQYWKKKLKTAKEAQNKKIQQDVKFLKQLYHTKVEPIITSPAGQKVIEYGKTGINYVTRTSAEAKRRVMEVRNVDDAIDLITDATIYVQEKGPEVAALLQSQAEKYAIVAHKWGKENLTEENVKAATKDFIHKTNGVVLWNPFLLSIANQVADDYVDELTYIAKGVVYGDKYFINAPVDFIVKNNEVVLDDAGNVLQGFATIPCPETKFLNDYYLAKNSLSKLDGDDILALQNGLAAAPAEVALDYAEDVIINGSDSVKQFCEEHGITYDNTIDAIEFTQARFENTPTMSQFSERLAAAMYLEATAADEAVSDIIWNQGVLNNTVDAIENKYENLVDNVQNFIENATLTYDFSNIPTKDELNTNGLSILDYIKSKTGEIFSYDSGIDGIDGIYHEVLTTPSYLKDTLDGVDGKLFNNGVVNMFIPAAETSLDDAMSYIIPPLPNDTIMTLTLDKNGGYSKGTLSRSGSLLTVLDKITLPPISGTIKAASLLVPPGSTAYIQSIINNFGDR